MTVSSNLLRPVIVKGLYTYAIKDRPYTTRAITALTSRFVPSGSLKNINIVLENTIEVIPKINNENFFDLKYIIIRLVIRRVF